MSPKVHRPNAFRKTSLCFSTSILAVFSRATGWPASPDGGDPVCGQRHDAASRAIRSGLTLSKVSTAEWCVYLYSGESWFMLMPAARARNKRPRISAEDGTVSTHSPKAFTDSVNFVTAANQVIAVRQVQLTTGPWPLSIQRAPHGWPVRPCAFWCRQEPTALVFSGEEHKPDGAFSVCSPLSLWLLARPSVVATPQPVVGLRPAESPKNQDGRPPPPTCSGCSTPGGFLPPRWRKSTGRCSRGSDVNLEAHGLACVKKAFQLFWSSALMLTREFS